MLANHTGRAHKKGQRKRSEAKQARDMKMVCVRNSLYLTYGKTYDVECSPRLPVNKSSVYITNDIGRVDMFPMNYFLYQEEWRNKQLNELGI